MKMIRLKCAWALVLLKTRHCGIITIHFSLFVVLTPNIRLSRLKKTKTKQNSISYAPGGVHQSKLPECVSSNHPFSPCSIINLISLMVDAQTSRAAESLGLCSSHTNSPGIRMSTLLERAPNVPIHTRPIMLLKQWFNWSDEGAYQLFQNPFCHCWVPPSVWIWSVDSSATFRKFVWQRQKDRILSHQSFPN